MFFIKQFVREPRQENILDLVFTNNETLVSQVERLGTRFDVSDHHEIRFKIIVKR